MMLVYHLAGARMRPEAITLYSKVASVSFLCVSLGRRKLNIDARIHKQRAACSANSAH